MTLRNKSWSVLLAVGLFGCDAAKSNPSSNAVSPISKDPQTQAAVQKIASEVGDMTAISDQSRDVCPDTGEAHKAHCLSKIRLAKNGKIFSSSAVAGPTSGMGATDLEKAYNVQAAGGAGVTVATVLWYDDPNAESDLGVYRAQYGLPPCTTANGCFKKVDQTGGTSYPQADGDSAIEETLDLDMISAGCPQCKIMLVEATTADMTDLGAAEDEAVALGATVVSNSYGSQGGEDPTAVSEEQYFTHAGVTIFASAGDSLYGPESPATSAGVLAVGGTTLTADSSARGYTETVWNSDGGGTGSGCSVYIAKPAWQNDPDCTMRMETDLSANADPNTGPAIYDTYPNTEGAPAGWFVVGGTSASSPLTAGIFASSGLAGVAPSYVYSHTAAFWDATSGNNGTGGSYMCTGEVGYDGPTGWGTPNGAALVNGGGAQAQPAPPASGGTCAGGSSGGGGTCDHSICSVGDPLNPSCDPCAEIICTFDSSCCTSSWDETCAGVAQLLCSSDC